MDDRCWSQGGVRKQSRTHAHGTMHPHACGAATQKTLHGAVPGLWERACTHQAAAAVAVWERSMYVAREMHGDAARAMHALGRPVPSSTSAKRAFQNVPRPCRTYNPQDGRGLKKPASKEQAMQELVTAVSSAHVCTSLCMAHSHVQGTQLYGSSDVGLVPRWWRAGPTHRARWACTCTRPLHAAAACVACRRTRARHVAATARHSYRGAILLHPRAGPKRIPCITDMQP